MAGFLYYIAGGSDRWCVGDLIQRGLGHAFDSGDTAAPRGVARGPDGSRGVVYANPQVIETHQIKFDPNSQDWVKIPKTDSVWVGRYKDQEIKPDDLMKKSVLDGYWVELGDGNKWLVPVARTVSDDGGILQQSTPLPRDVTLNSEGVWVNGGIQAKYQPLFEMAMKFWEAIAAGIHGNVEQTEQVVVDFQSMAEGSILALQANYKISAAEVSALGLFNGDPTKNIMLATIDWDHLTDWLKKKIRPLIEDGSNTSDGPKESPQDTGPQLPT